MSTPHIEMMKELLEDVPNEDRLVFLVDLAKLNDSSITVEDKFNVIESIQNKILKRDIEDDAGATWLAYIQERYTSRSRISSSNSYF